MKKTLLVLALIQFSLVLSAQDSLLIRTIDSVVTKIDHTELWEKVSPFEIENFSIANATLHLYYNTNGLSKLELKANNKYYDIANTYYLRKESVIFVYQITIEKPTNAGEDTSSQEGEVFEIKSYFKDGALIHQLDNVDGGHPFSKEYLEAEGASILDEFTVLLALTKTERD